MSVKPRGLAKNITNDSLGEESFDDIVGAISNGDIRSFDVNYEEKAWENIPYIVPKSVFILNQKLKAVQELCGKAQNQITTILSDTFMEGIKRELQSEKNKRDDFETNLQTEIENILKKFNVLDELNKKRTALEEKDNVDEYYFHKFFKEEVETKQVREHKYLDVSSNSNLKGEAEELRRYSLKQLHYIICKLLDQSRLNLKVMEIDEQMKIIENRLEEKMDKQFAKVNEKLVELDQKINKEKDELKKQFEQKDNEIMSYVDNEVVGRLIEDEGAIKQTLDVMEDLKEDIEENRNFREKANERLEKMFKQNNVFLNTFEKKIVFYDENFEMMKSKTEEKLTAFRESINEKFKELQEHSRDHVNRMKQELTNITEENHKKYVENIEKLMSKTTKDLFALDFETKRVLESFRFEITKSSGEVTNKCQTLEGKLDSFIHRFEVYSKTKIEPAFNNEAKVHALESRFGEQDEYISHSTLLIKNVLKKLIYAIQKHNLGHMKWVEEEEAPKDRRSIGTPSSAYMTEVRESNALGSTNAFQDDFRHTFHQSWGRRLNSVAGARRSGDRFSSPLAQIDAIHNISNIVDQSLITLPNTAKSQKRNQSFDVDKVCVPKGEESTTRQFEFDDVLHKRLEVLRKALVDANFISQKYNETIGKELTSQGRATPKEAVPRNSFLNYYKDINMVKITSHGTRRKLSLNNKSVIQPNAEFGDIHLLQENADAIEKKSGIP